MANFKRILNLRSKMILIILLSSLIPTIVMGLYSYNNSSDALKKEIIKKLVAVKEIKEESVKRYFASIKSQVKTMSQNKMVVNAMEEFSEAFEEIKKEKISKPNPIRKARQDLQQYYFQNFQKEYERQNGTTKDLKNIFSNLKDETVYLQNKYISNNPNPLGQKDLLNRVSGNFKYFKVHETYHPFLRNFLKEFGFYDIFLVDIDSGNIVYSVFKEIDFATSLLSGPYSKTNFGEVFRNARDLKNKGEFVVVDYNSYFPSYEAPASFIAAPIFKGNKKIGVLIFQMPIERLNRIMEERSGMGETGETYLVGSDYLMRSDSFLKKETHSTENSFRNPERGKLISKSIKKALKKEIGFLEEKDYLGNDVLVSYASVDMAKNITWALIAKINEKEAYSSIYKLKTTIIWAIITLAALIFILGYYFSNSITMPVQEISRSIEKEAQDISNISKEIGNSSDELSQSSEIQSTAIHQTIVNMVHFSDMLSSSNKTLSSGLELAQSGEASATNGIKVIEKMLTAMNEIQRSNQKLQAIVRAINRIRKETLVIDEIVSETRLLSFNASIEAARAGEHGKGFSLIAEEVGNLAKISGNASLEIKKILNESTRQVGEVVEVNKSKVDDGRIISRQCEEVFQETTDYLKRILSSVETINKATRQQEAGITETNNYMSEMENIIELNRNNSKKLKMQSDNLAVNQNSLHNVIKRLKDILGDNNI